VPLTTRAGNCPPSCPSEEDREAKLGVSKKHCSEGRVHKRDTRVHKKDAKNRGRPGPAASSRSRNRVRRLTSSLAQSITLKYPIGDDTRLLPALRAIWVKLAQNIGDAFRRFNIIAVRFQARGPGFEGCLVNAKPISHQGPWHPRRLKLGEHLQLRCRRIEWHFLLRSPLNGGPPLTVSYCNRATTNLSPVAEVFRGWGWPVPGLPYVQPGADRKQSAGKPGPFNACRALPPISCVGGQPLLGDEVGKISRFVLVRSCASSGASSSQALQALCDETRVPATWQPIAMPGAEMVPLRRRKHGNLGVVIAASLPAIVQALRDGSVRRRNEERAHSREEEMDSVPLEVWTAFQVIAAGGLLILAVYIINYIISKWRK
jgi:hypothetical protein